MAVLDADGVYSKSHPRSDPKSRSDGDYRHESSPSHTRTELTKVRNGLKAYYATEGLSDLILFEVAHLPGGCTIIFRDEDSFRQEAPAPEAIAGREPSDFSPPATTAFQKHREILAKWRPEDSQVPTPVPVRQNEEWEVIDRWNAFPEVPPFEEVRKKIKLRKAFKWTGGAIGFLISLVWALTSPIPRGDWTMRLFSIGFLGYWLGGFGYLGAIWIFQHFVAPKTTTWNWHSSVDVCWAYEPYEDSTILDPHQLFWHPHQPYLYVSRDHQNLTAWKLTSDADDSKRLRHDPVGPSGVQRLFSAGKVEKGFFSHDFFAARSTSSGSSDYTAADQHWTIYDSIGNIEASVLHRYSTFNLFGDGRSNPLRPGRYCKEILCFPSNEVMTLCDLSKMPRYSKIASSDYTKLREYAKSEIPLRMVRVSDTESVGSFAWHPSGAYLAVETNGRLSILNWDGVEVVSEYVPSHGAKFEVKGWNHDASLLALDDKADFVWDARIHKIRPATADERWRIRDEGNIENKLTSCDGLRSFHGRQHKPKYARWGREFSESPSDRLNQALGDVADVAWCPNDPAMFATIGGTECPRDIRIWRLKELFTKRFPSPSIFDDAGSKCRPSVLMFMGFYTRGAADGAICEARQAMLATQSKRTRNDPWGFSRADRG